MFKLILTAWLVIAVPLISVDKAFAGGASGSGKGSGVVGGIGTFVNYTSARHAIGLDYALTNEEFIGQLETAMLKMAAISTGAPSASVDILMEMKKAFDLIEYSNKSRLDFTFVNKTVRAVLETSLIPVKAKFPGFSDALTISKLAASFTTAYAYGFFFGK